MAGSIKIQHGATASTPQAGFSTLWVRSSDGQFYYTKPNGSSEPLVGATGAAGVAGPTGSVGPTGVAGAGLSTKNIQWGGTAGWVRATDPYGNLSNYYDVVFAAPFASTNYTADFYQETGPTSSSGLTGLFADTVLGGTIVTFTNKTAAGIRVWNQFNGLSIPQYGTVSDIWNVKAIALGETSVSHYGNFYDTTTQSNAGATAANAITYNTTDLSSGVSVVSTSRITIANAGIYNIEFSAQLQKNSGGDDQVDIWLSKNGTNVPNSNTTIMLHSNPGYEVAAWNFLVNAASGDYYELYWSSADTTAVLHAASAGTNPTRPAIPSVILSVTQVSTA